MGAGSCESAGSIAVTGVTVGVVTGVGVVDTTGGVVAVVDRVVTWESKLNFTSLHSLAYL